MTSDAPPPVRWHAHSSRETLISDVINRLTALAHTAIAARARFDIVLAGGETPRELYRQLGQQPCDWAHWHIWFGDERCLPPNTTGRNDDMARDTWLQHVSVPPQHICPLDAPDAAARLAQTPIFDLVLLGLGEDGHTASLFPGHDWGCAPNAPAILSVSNAPKPPSSRLSLSAARLSATRHAWFLVCGTSKQPALQRWRTGESLPAAAIRPAQGVDVFHSEH